MAVSPEPRSSTCNAVFVQMDVNVSPVRHGRLEGRYLPYSFFLLLGVYLNPLSGPLLPSSPS